MFLPPEYDSKNKYENGPEMWINEIEFLKNLLEVKSKNNKQLKILEWGSGNGTIFYSIFLNQKNINYKWHAIENFKPWYDKVITMIDNEGLGDFIQLHLVESTDEDDKIKQESMPMEGYYTYPGELGIQFDVILIDGRKREECLHHAHNYLNDDGVVILHDAERKQYHGGFVHYKNNGEFVTENVSPNSQNGIQKMWIGKIR